MSIAFILVDRHKVLSMAMLETYIDILEYKNK